VITSRWLAVIPIDHNR